MRSSKLKLNPDKTEVLLFGTKLHRKEFMKHFSAKLLDQEITPTDSARNLGVVFDGGLNFRKHISLVCRSCYYHTRDLRRLRRCLTSDVSKTIATGSSKLSGPSSDTFSSFFQKSLHWLPVCFRIKFKICLVSFSDLVILCPGMLSL